MVVLDAAELPRDLIFVDLETTGGNPAHHRITEIGIVRVCDDAVVEEWSTLVNPGCVIPPYIESFTGITNEMVEAAPRFTDLSALVLDKLRMPTAVASAGKSPPVFVAHNARFDYSFLRAEFRRAGMTFSAPVLCTVKLSRRLFPGEPRHNLDALMERHGLSCSARHRALGDARVVSDFWAALKVSTPEIELARAACAVLRTAKLPAHLPDGIADELPEGWGVYRLRGVDGAVLFVAKAACLRSAVLRHFATPSRGACERARLQDQVRHIDWTETTGELGAALLELSELRAFEPSYDRRPRACSSGWTVRIGEQSGAASIRAVDELGLEELECAFGLFQSEKDAHQALREIARAKQLCLAVLGLEPSAGSCFARQLGTCKGACIGREPRALHAVRVRTALVPLKLKAWPFAGRIALLERGPLGSLDRHVLDRWAYLGTARDEEGLEALAARSAPGRFDTQVYRILTRYLATHPRLEWCDLAVAAPRGVDHAY